MVNEITPTWATHPWVAEAHRTVRFSLYALPDPDWARTADLAASAEAWGFDCFWVADHPVGDRREAWTTLAGLAGMTKTIRLGSLVTCVHYRSPTLLARIVADVDRQSGGRVVLGIGSGDNEHEFAQLGIAFPSLRDRQAALEEALRIVRGVWADTPLTCEGDYFRVTDSQVSPGPAQQPSVPILIAGGGERVTLRQVARYADASNFGPGSVIGNAWTLEDVRRKCKALQRYCDAVGRPFNSVLRTYFGGIAALGDGVAAEQRRFRTGIGVYDIFAGTPHDAIAHFRALLDAGMQYFIVGFLQDPFAQSQILAEKVIPELTAG